MDKKYRIGHTYKDILSVSRKNDEFVSWFSLNGSGIGNSGGIRAAKYLNIKSQIPAYIVLITRNTSHRWYNPWEDIIDYSTGTIFYWGDAKFDSKKNYSDFRGNKHLVRTFERILENNMQDVPPILHFSKVEKGVVKFNGLCALTKLELTWFEDKGNPVKNYRSELAILDEEKVDVAWLHDRAKCTDLNYVNYNAPNAWKDYIKGNIKKLNIWSKSIFNKEEQLPPFNSNEAALLKQLHELTPIQFEAVVVELFKNLPHVNHKIVRTRPTADGGFDFYGQFSIPYPVKYEIEFLGEAKKYFRDSPVRPNHVSRLVARLRRGQFGIFVTTSYYTPQTQKEVLEDGYPVKLFTGNDLVNILKELRLDENGKIKNVWLETVLNKIEIIQ
ncbi:restriction endonuclease [Mangrovivirga sp. M17]|uniref:Restriction endonuclease n=1 Tax=Mangrovivirga halotolerans TaxID=2993936 RepID=A0ABT3RQ99_9BACT|nr:restriction endonuclease [Mangrovivirga halotolerans]MCX2743661.1 restriction endonuclease [Mangrovivirga halotolerans]